MAHITYETTRFVVVVGNMVRSHHSTRELAEKRMAKIPGSHIELYREYCERMLAPYGMRPADDRR